MSKPEGDPAQASQELSQQKLLTQFGRIMEGWRRQEREVGDVLIQHLRSKGARAVDRPEVPDRYKSPMFVLPATGADPETQVYIRPDSFHLGDHIFSTNDLYQREPEVITRVFDLGVDFLRQRRLAVTRSTSQTA